MALALLCTGARRTRKRTMTRERQIPLQPQPLLEEGQELIGILEVDEDLLEDDEVEPDDDEDVAADREPPAGAPWDQLIAAVDREFLPLHAPGASRGRSK